MLRETFDKFYKEMAKGEPETSVLRSSLSVLRQECREESGKQALLYYLTEEKQALLLSALSFPDAKVRKNAALLLGVLGKKEFLPALFSAYEQEKQLFVKSAYLQAMMEYDFRQYLEPLALRKKALEEVEFTEENKSSRKHIDEEYHLLSEMLLMMEGGGAHEFRGYHELSDVLLMTNRNHAEITLAEVFGQEISEARTVNVGVLVRTDRIHRLLKCRTFAEMLFILPFSGEEGKGILSRNLIPGVTADELYFGTGAENGGTQDGRNPALVGTAKAIVEAGLLPFLEKRHKGKAPFYFRIEWKGKLESSKKGVLIRRLAAEIERQSSYKLVNLTGNYDVELRIVENSRGAFNLLLRLCTIPEERFAYRINSTAGSIRPVNAALTAALAQKYLIDDARVLDPFCGVGTMLIERHKYKKANTMYGIDIYGKAIEGARENTEAAHEIIHYINRDFFEFRHEYLFDEIFTNMPMVQGKQTERDIEGIYRKFFVKAGEHLTERGIIILYTHNISFARRYAKESGFCVLDVYEISQREECFVAVFGRR